MFLVPAVLPDYNTFLYCCSHFMPCIFCYPKPYMTTPLWEPLYKFKLSGILIDYLVPCAFKTSEVTGEVWREREHFDESPCGQRQGKKASILQVPTDQWSLTTWLNRGGKMWPNFGTQNYNEQTYNLQAFSFLFTDFSQICLDTPQKEVAYCLVDLFLPTDVRWCN